MKKLKESIRSQFIHVFLPTIIAVVVVSVSLSLDLSTQNDFYWFQRSGSLLGATGIYIAFHEGSQRMKVDGNKLEINTDIWYQWLGLSFGIIGTIIWAYGDIPFK